MGNGNGKDTNAAPPMRSGVPLVGQVFTLKNWFLTALGMCNCESPEPIMIVGQFGSALGQCPACKRFWTMTDLRHDTRTGTIEIDFGLMRQQTPEEAKAALDALLLKAKDA